MKNSLKRIGTTVVVLGSGVGLVLALSFAGEKSRGPVDDLLKTVGEKVTAIEYELVTEVREGTRSDSLQWFDSYRKGTRKLKNPDRLLWGAYANETSDSYEKTMELEDSLNMRFPILQIYNAWGSKQQERFPKVQVKAIYDLGSVPMITWEPWLNDFDASVYPPDDPTNPNNGSLKAIASGKYDNYIRKWAGEAKVFGAPVMVRFGHEMNDPYRYPWGPQQNKPEEFIAAWKHIVDLFRTVGANNVIWMWSPHPAYKGYEAYYPGAEYVDWVGVPVLNYGTVADWSMWWSFDDIFSGFYKNILVYNKPVMITELASLNVGGNRKQWYIDALSNLNTRYPLVKSVLFFHTDDDNTTTYKSLNWTFTHQKEVLLEMRKLIRLTGQVN